MANEKRLIDADAFLKDILTAGIGKTIIEYSESDIGYMIRKRHTVDVVEVVRCQECKHYATSDFDGDILCGCTLPSAMLDITPDSVCSYGERKDDDGNG